MDVGSLWVELQANYRFDEPRKEFDFLSMRIRRKESSGLRHLEIDLSAYAGEIVIAFAKEWPDIQLVRKFNPLPAELSEPLADMSPGMGSVSQSAQRVLGMVL